jgi:thiol-disulfide isomerase/thioredoxin
MAIGQIVLPLALVLACLACAETILEEAERPVLVDSTLEGAPTPPPAAAVLVPTPKPEEPKLPESDPATVAPAASLASEPSSPTPTATPVPPPPTATRVQPSVRVAPTGDDPPADDFEMTTLSGEPFALSDLRGQVVVLNFWASWCAPCRWEMPAFERMYQQYGDREVAFVGVAVSDVERDAVAFIAKTGITYLVGLDTTGEIARAYRVLSLPTTFFIGPDGNIVRKLSNVANDAVLRIFIEGQLGEMGQP